jgi:hypothetical protein
MLKKPESLNYNTSTPGDEKKNIVMNVYQSGIGEIFIALQLDLEIPTFIGTSKEYNICKGDFQEKIN